MTHVPEGWKASRLGEVVAYTKGYAFSSDDYSDAGIRIIRISDTTEFEIKNDNPVFLPPEKKSGLEKYMLSSNDIIINTVGSRPHLRASMVGKVIRIPSENAGSLLNQNMVKISANDLIQKDFLYRSISNDRFLDFIGSIVRGNANQVSITLKDLFKFPINLPPLPEQKKIAEILSTWDTAITAQEKLIANSEAQKKALMQQLLTGKKRLKGFSGERSYMGFDKVFKTSNDKKTQVTKKQYLESGSTPIVDQGQQKIAGYTNNANAYCDTPVIIFGDHTRVLKWIDFRFCPGADGTQILKTKNGIDIRFGYYILQNTELPNLGYSRHMRELKEKEFLLPIDPKEQTAIAAILSDADSEIELQQQKLAALKQEKAALMQQLLTGKRRVEIDKQEQAA